MWDPTCLVSPACEETKSVYRLSTPPTPLLDEAMSVSPQKSSPTKERLQPVTEEAEVVKVVMVKKERRKVQSRSDLLAQALEQARITSATKSKDNRDEPPAAKSSPATAEPSPTTAKPKSTPPKKKSTPTPKVPIAPLAVHPGDGCPGRYTQTMQQVVERAFAAKPTNLIGVYGQASLTGKSMATMRDGKQLDDNIINSYYHLIEERAKLPGYPSLIKKDIYFYTFLSHRKAGWAPKASCEMFLVDYVFFPVGIEKHWMLVYTCIESRKLFYLDSLLSERRANEVLGNIKACMYNSSVKLHGKDNAWVFTTEIVRTVPQQVGGIDCRIFTCQYPEHIAREAGIGFTQEDVPQIRRNMVWELMT